MATNFREGVVVIKLLFICAAVAVSGSAEPLVAQRITPVALIREQSVDTVSNDSQPSAARHFWTGAAVGAVVIGTIGILGLVAESTDSMASPLLLVPMAGAGAIVGGFLGLVVHSAKRPRPAT